MIMSLQKAEVFDAYYWEKNKNSLLFRPAKPRRYILPPDQPGKLPKTLDARRLQKASEGGNGEKLLLVSVVLVATLDYFDRSRKHADDARWFFADVGGAYTAVLEALGLPDDYLPVGVRFIEVGRYTE
jgi:hypothetical protein